MTPATTMATASWSYETDECWGTRGELLLSARLSGNILTLAIRNTRSNGLEVLVGNQVHRCLHPPQGQTVLKIGFDDRQMRSVACTRSTCGETYFLTEQAWVIANLQCANRVRVYARCEDSASWLKLDVVYPDLEMQRIVDPESGILYQITPDSGHSFANAPVGGMSGMSGGGLRQIAGAALPLIGAVAGYKAGYALTGPRKKRDRQ